MSPQESSKSIVGILIKKGDTLQLQPLSKSKKQRSKLYSLNSGDAKEGDIVAAKLGPDSAGGAKVTRVLGQKDTPGIFSLISLYEQGLSDIFSQAALKQAQSLTVPDLAGREDLRDIPLVTVDGKDSRDFDDAIFAEDTADGGKHLIVAIADVSWYVRPGDAIDQDAYQRGNSTYFPDRAVAMLPEELSNGLCSLKPNEDRACMAYHLWIDKDGKLVDKKINRALMRSAARLTYEQLQAAKDGKPDATTAPLMDTVVNPLYAAHKILKGAAEKRGMLNLETPVYKAEVNDKGETINVALEDDSTSHDVIAQFMILANVAGDMALNEAKAEAMHRFHSAPPDHKIKALSEYLDTFGLKLPSGEMITDSQPFKDVIDKAKQLPNSDEVVGNVTRAIARAQSKAIYDSQRDGHFGLALPGYGHHTSPIRRYADLINHRSLVSAFNMGAGGLDSRQKADIQEIAEHISHTEVLSMRAERSADDRFAADYLSTQIGKEFKGRISGVIGAGVFVKLNGVGSEGLLLAHSLPKDHYNFDEGTRTLTGSHNGLVYKSGDEIAVRVKEADGLTGSVVLTPANDNKSSAAPKAPHQNNKKKKNGGYKPG